MEYEILGKGRRRRYNPDLGRIANEEFEKRKGKKIEKSEDPMSSIEEAEAALERFEDEMMNRPPVQTDVMDQIMKAYKSLWSFGSLSRRDIKKKVPYLEGLRITSEHIYNFSSDPKLIVGNANFDEIAPQFMSVLMNLSEEKRFLIDITHLSNQGVYLDRIGCGLEGKKLTVAGNVGDYFASGASESEFHLNGFAGGRVINDTYKCKAFISEYVGIEAGLEAKRCELKVRGDAREGFGKAAYHCKLTAKETSDNVADMAEHCMIYLDTFIKWGGVGEGTKIFTKDSGKYKQVYPVTNWMKFKRWLWKK